MIVVAHVSAVRSRAWEPLPAAAWVAVGSRDSHWRPTIYRWLHGSRLPPAPLGHA